MTGQLILSIETATPVCSVVLSDGSRLSERRSDQRGAHAEQLPFFIRDLLDERGVDMDDVDGVVLSAGPGSYTGLRIGASIVKGLLFGRSLPFVAVNTLAGLAQGVVTGDDCHIHSVIDARRTHLYHQEFVAVDGRIRALGVPVARDLAEIGATIERGHRIVGTGWSRLEADALHRAHAVGTQAISAANLDALFRSASTPGGEYGEVILRRARVEIFEPDYRGNPFQ